MERSNHLRSRRSLLLLVIVALIIVAADQFTKLWVSAHLYLGQSVPANGFFRLTLVHNTGAAFGLFRGHSQPLSAVSVAGIVLVIAFTVFIQRRFQFMDRKLVTTAMGLVLGGIIGNLTDRLRLGYVTDFIDVGIWPNFNVADSAVVVGILMFAFSLYLSDKASKGMASEAHD